MIGKICDEQIVCEIILGVAHHDAHRNAVLKDTSLTVKDCKEHFAHEATDAHIKQL